MLIVNLGLRGHCEGEAERFAWSSSKLQGTVLLNFLMISYLMRLKSFGCNGLQWPKVITPKSNAENSEF